MKTALIGSEADDGESVVWSWTSERGDTALIEWDIAGAFEPAPKVRRAVKPAQSRSIEKPKAPRAVHIASEQREVVVPKEGRKP
jgi:hypothetical protein